MPERTRAAPMDADAGTDGRARRERGTRSRTTEGDARERETFGRSVVVGRWRRAFIHSFIHSRGGRLNFERARGGARRDVEDARESERDARERDT